MASAKQILNYERELKEAGATEKLAEIHAQKLAEIIESTLVTKTYFDVEMRILDGSIKRRVDDLETKIVIQNAELKAEFYRFFIGAFISMVTISGVMQTIFHYWK